MRCSIPGCEAPDVPLIDSASVPEAAFCGKAWTPSWLAGILPGACLSKFGLGVIALAEEGGVPEAFAEEAGPRAGKLEENEGGAGRGVTGEGRAVIPSDGVLIAGIFPDDVLKLEGEAPGCRCCCPGMLLPLDSSREPGNAPG